MNIKGILFKIFRKNQEKDNLWYYYLSRVNRKNKDRIKYLATESQIMINYNSTDEEVNEWLNYLYLLSNNDMYRERGILNSRANTFINKKKK